jgi:hypothetical protein
MVMALSDLFEMAETDEERGVIPRYKPAKFNVPMPDTKIAPRGAIFVSLYIPYYSGRI